MNALRLVQDSTFLQGSGQDIVFVVTIITINMVKPADVIVMDRMLGLGNSASTGLKQRIMWVVLLIGRRGRYQFTEGKENLSMNAPRPVGGISFLQDSGRDFVFVVTIVTTNMENRADAIAMDPMLGLGNSVYTGMGRNFMTKIQQAQIPLRRTEAQIPN